ncbi:MAG: hypothetical protein ACREVW_15280, partial [Burkholderiales bacterium]
LLKGESVSDAGTAAHSSRVGDAMFDLRPLTDSSTDTQTGRFVAGGRATIEVIPGESFEFVGRRVEGAVDGAETGPV